jgi:hypothetical protein
MVLFSNTKCTKEYYSDDSGLFVRIQAILQSSRNNAMIPTSRVGAREKAVSQTAAIHSISP